MEVQLMSSHEVGAAGADTPKKFRYGAPQEWPVFTGGADEVGIFIRVNQVDKVDLTNQQVGTSGILNLFWRCPGWSFPQTQDFTVIADEDVPDAEPQPQWVTSQEMKVLNKFTYVVPSKEYLVTEHHFRGIFVDPIDASAFPFDWQDFTIAIGLTPSKQSGKVRYTMLMAPIIFTTNQAIPEWQVHGKGEAPGTAMMHGGKIKTMFSKYSEDTGHFARCWFRFYIRRYAQYYIYNIFVMTFLISSLSICSFAIPFEDVADRLSFNVTLMLTLVALKFVVAGMIPKVPYMTMMDIRLNLSCAVLIAAMLVQSGSVYLNSDAVSDRWVGVVYAAVLMVVEAFLAIKCWLLAHFKPQEDWEGGAPIAPVP